MTKIRIPHTLNCSPSTIASSFLSKFQSLGPQVRTQTLDPNQLRLLSLTLNRPSLFPSLSPSPSSSSSSGSSNPSPNLTTTPPPESTPLPPAYHLVYFTPAFQEHDLGPDGTDISYNPSHPFTRRMWAGGEVNWPRLSSGRPNPLRVGQEVTETTRVLSAEAKTVKKTGEDMIVVGVEKEFANRDGVAVVDRRNWVFRKELDRLSSNPAKPSPSPSSRAEIDPSPAHAYTTSSGPTHTRTLKQSPVTLFRFSALTFNPHKIHYSLPWARDVEGHRDLVVHGPLNLISILDLWRDVAAKGSEDPAVFLPEKVEYRATSPLYVGDEYRIVLEENGSGNGGKVQILDPQGTVGMKADITGSA